MIVEALAVCGALALAVGLKIWLTWRRIRTARRLKELAPATPAGSEEAPVQRR